LHDEVHNFIEYGGSRQESKGSEDKRQKKTEEKKISEVKVREVERERPMTAYGLRSRSLGDGGR